ncbi:MAG: type II toxin-antitoxin system mRNA interferase toxin, RelE/StbE family [Candidatus Levybacteria bacterium]|nr:type II toxin-antitoxin system mRNA interferase toxin, RelE/StbE family [Candidatus Levybacteria bacterium]
MKIAYHKRFKKHFQERIALNPNLKKRYEERLHLFLVSPTSPQLKNHALKGSMYGYRAFSITGDIRVVYLPENDTIRFYDIGTHNQVY